MSEYDVGRVWACFKHTVRHKLCMKLCILFRFPSAYYELVEFYKSGPDFRFDERRNLIFCFELFIVESKVINYT